MKYLCLAGLILLPGLLLPGADFPPGRQWFDADLRVATENDPERLFSEAIEQYQAGDDAGVKLRIDEACRIWLKQGEQEKAARARMQIADQYRDDRRFGDALEQYQQAVATPGIASILTASIYDSTGQIYAQLYEAELAFKYYSQALELARAAHASTEELQIQLDLAILQGKTGNLAEGIGLAKNAVAIGEKANDRPLLAFAQFVLGQLEFKRGPLPNGKAELEKALALYQQQGDLPGQINALRVLSGLSLAAKDFTRALEQAETAYNLADRQMQQATTSAQKSRANELRWPCSLAKGRALRAAQRLEDAKKAYGYAVAGAFLSFWMAYRSTDRSAVGFSDDRQEVYREWVDLNMDLGKPDEAYNAYQQGHVSTLLGSILTRQAQMVKGVTVEDPTLTQLSATIVGLRTKLMSPGLTATQREQIEQELDDVESETTEIRVKAEIKKPRMAYSTRATVKKLQQQMATRNESIIEFDLGEERSFAWLISAQNLNVEVLPGRKEIELKVGQYIDGLSHAPAGLYLSGDLEKQRSRGDELFKLLFGKLAAKLTPNSDLLVIPDGLLNYLPFDTLVNGDRFLIEEHQISYLPSAGVIELLRPAAAKAKVAESDKPNLLAFGDPSFGSKATTGKNPAVRLLASERDYWNANSTSLTPLPRTRDEVEYIARLLPKERARTYLGKDCSEGAFKHEKLNGYKWIHLATHSLIDDLSPARSAVVLTSAGDQSEDGLLRAGEIMNLNLDCDLVVLSACQTGRGRVSSGEGILGLSRSFLIAGARSLIVSQWPVSDISTAQLMKDLYAQLVTGSGPPAALRAAKLKMLRSKSETRHPYYWAPFISIAAPQ